MVPGAERACLRCGTILRSDLVWKLPLIVLMFLAAFAISYWIAMAR